MEYQKIINLLDDKTNQPFKSRSRNWVEINYESKRKYDSSNIRLKRSVIRPDSCDYSDVDIFVKGTITVPGMEAAGAAVNNSSKKSCI